MNSESLPEVLPLIQRGLAIYREEFDTLVGLNALYLAFSFLGLSAFIGSLVLVGYSALSLGLVGFGLMSLVGVIVAVLFFWLLLRILLATLYTIRDYDEHLSIREAFARGRGKVWEFLWVLVLTSLAVIGSLAVVFVIGAIVLYPIYYVAPEIIVQVLFMFVWLGSLIAILITSTWFAFTSWLFIDQDARGLHALALSRHLSHNHLPAVMWRVFCVGVIAIVFYVLVQWIFHLIFSFLPYVVGNLFVQTLVDVVICLTLIPMMYCTMFSLYISVEAEQEIDTDTKLHGEHRGMLATLIFFGFLAVCALPAIIGPGLH